MIRRIRAAPSGPNVQPTPGEGALAWNGSAPLIVTLLPAGHDAGLYNCEVVAFITTAGTGGTYSSVLSWAQPIFGAASLSFGAVNFNATGLTFTINRAIESSGVSAILWTATPAGLTGTPAVRVIASAQLIATPVDS